MWLSYQYVYKSTTDSFTELRLTVESSQQSESAVKSARNLNTEITTQYYRTQQESAMYSMK